MTSKSHNQFRNILEGDYCIGCGMCAALSNKNIRMEFDERGQYVPRVELESVDEESINQILNVCPFSDRGPDEDTIARQLYAGIAHDEGLGYYRSLYAGSSSNPAIRDRGSSGAVATWVLSEMMRTRAVDAVIHVQTSGSKRDGVLFKYAISRSVSDVLRAGKSKYYPIELSGVVSLVEQNPGRYAFVGLPCYVKALRRYAEFNSLIKTSIVYYVGLVCGHLKSRGFAEGIAWSNGVRPSDLDGFEFRTKLKGEKASNYGVTIRSQQGEQIKPVKNFIGANWGLGFFKYNACEYCDDIFAETADIVIGDAWLPEYIQDEGGTSLVLVRNSYFEGLLASGIETGDLNLDSLSKAQALQTQAAGLRHRRSGLKYRLYLNERKGKWNPEKRCSPDSSHLGFYEKMLQRVRLATVFASHKAWVGACRRNKWSFFERRMKPWLWLNRVVLRIRNSFGGKI